MPGDPAAVWSLIQRADELIKYASNRDERAAYAQARAALTEAEILIPELDEPQRVRFTEQIALRRGDLDRYDPAS
ncbi:MAG TPA: hypothetical protein VM600_04035 [Actinomycetota bacterium]|nr:hypothetical protein [Actinomycetota bacterium]